jgi:hypothetical protein
VPYMKLAHGQTGPLCPQAFPPFAPEHAIQRALLDAAYVGAPRAEPVEESATAELTPDADAVYTALAHDKITDYMDLYTHRVGFMAGRVYTEAEAFWFRCRVCGFVLPAQAADRPEGARS